MKLIHIILIIIFFIGEYYILRWILPRTEFLNGGKNEYRQISYKGINGLIVTSGNYVTYQYGKIVSSKFNFYFTMIDDVSEVYDLDIKMGIKLASLFIKLSEASKKSGIVNNVEISLEPICYTDINRANQFYEAFNNYLKNNISDDVKIGSYTVAIRRPNFINNIINDIERKSI